MNASQLIKLMVERDRELGVSSYDYNFDCELSTSVMDLFTEKAVKLLNGGVVEFVRDLDTFRAGFNGEPIEDDERWGGAHGRNIVIKYTSPDKESCLFKMTGFYDSWDNGLSDEWKDTDIVPYDSNEKDGWQDNDSWGGDGSW